MSYILLSLFSRHLFYLDVRKAFIENKLHTTIEQLYRLSALIAQIEIGDLDPANGLTLALINYPKYLPTNCCLAQCNLDKPRHIRVRWRSGGSSDSSTSNTDQPDSDAKEQEQVKFF